MVCSISLFSLSVAVYPLLVSVRFASIPPLVLFLRASYQFTFVSVRLALALLLVLKQIFPPSSVPMTRQKLVQ
jgi:hypothetical protein